MDVIEMTLTIRLGVELDEGDELDTDLVEGEIRAFVSQYGEVRSVRLEHDGEEVTEDGAG